MRLIDADALADEMMKSSMPSHDIGGRYQTGFMDARSMVISATTIDPVKHGKWVLPREEGCITYDERAYAECSMCEKKSFLGWRDKYCRNCGAQMERDEE